MKIAAPSQLATPFHGLQNTSRFNQADGLGEVGRPNGSLGVGVELIIFVSLVFNPVRIFKPLASTSKAGGFLFRAIGPQHTKVLTKKKSRL